MSDESLPPPILVAEPAALAALVAALAPEPVIGVDTESNSLFAYRERVCLVQFSTPAADYIVDPLAVDDLSPLAEVFADPARQKVFHAAEYDVICLKRDYGFSFANLFDTMVAARTLGLPQLGLASILEGQFGVKMNKRFQRADWGQRPLGSDQLDYARLDTHYLVPLAEHMARELAALGRLEEAEEEFTRLERVAGGANGGVVSFWRINGARDLAPDQAAVLRELHDYREKQAERADRPPFKVMSDQVLVAIAKAAPHTEAELGQLPGMTRFQVQRHGANLLRAVRRGLQAEPARPPHTEREPDIVRERYEALHQWRKKRAQQRGVESDVIITRDALWELARRAPRTEAELEDLAHLGPWRRQTYGGEILEVLRQVG
jgi:ribonuclease D